MSESRSKAFGVITDARVSLMIPEDFYLVSVNNDVTPYEVTAELAPGCHIPLVLKQMIEVIYLVKVRNDIDFVFKVTANGIDMTLAGNMSPEEASSLWKFKLEEARKAYEASDAYIAAQLKRVEAVKKSQERVNYLLEIIHDPSLQQDQQRLGRWVQEFSLLNDDIDINFDKEELANLFESLGYKHNEFVGCKPEEFAGNEDMKFRWAMGQAIDHLRKGMPIHPVIGDRAAGIAPTKPTIGPVPDSVNN